MRFLAGFAALRVYALCHRKAWAFIATMLLGFGNAVISVVSYSIQADVGMLNEKF